MTDIHWVGIAQGAGAVATPLVAGWLVYSLGRRASRNTVLVSARLDYYRQLAPDLNSLMCYMTFIGTWKAPTPPEIISLKRRVDSTFHVAVPLFSAEVFAAYDKFMACCFVTFNNWGDEPRIRSSAYRRRPQCRPWHASWDALFGLGDEQAITSPALREIRTTYDALLAAMVKDIDVTPTRSNYTTRLVSLNAHAPARDDIPGKVS